MKTMARRLKALESAAGSSGDPVRVVFHVSVSPDDVANGRPGRLEIAHVIGGEAVARGDDEDKRAFLGRAAAAYELAHGPVPEDWYGCDAA